MIDPFGLRPIPSPCCSFLERLSGNCPRYEPEDIPTACIDKYIDDLCNKPCSAAVSACKKALGPSCYGAGTPCLQPCEFLGERCKEKRKKVCSVACIPNSNDDSSDTIIL